ncbi:MAG: hypothetical protein KatS3mg057_2063 [Herpetosiphonaceae bacterium]|nr:MAG: hypothetical protein KatS3mg057_2063 [Herpetosiphonaceae bacterium]
MEQESREQHREEQRQRFKRALERANARAAERRAAAKAALTESGPGQDTGPATPIPPASPKPLDAARLLDVRSPAPPEVRRPPLILASVAGLAWGAAVLLLLFGQFEPTAGLQQRSLYGLLLLIAGLLTFLPLQWSLRLPSLAWRGTVGWGLMFYTLAFVPAPNAWLLSLPDLPVYLILLVGIFLAVDAAMIPAMYALGLRLYHHRPARFDVQRAARQAAEVGLLVAGVVALAAMQALTLVSLLLLIAILGVTEIFILGGREV